MREEKFNKIIFFGLELVVLNSSDDLLKLFKKYGITKDAQVLLEKRYMGLINLYAHRKNIVIGFYMYSRRPFLCFLVDFDGEYYRFEPFARKCGKCGALCEGGDIRGYEITIGIKDKEKMLRHQKNINYNKCPNCEINLGEGIIIFNKKE